MNSPRHQFTGIRQISVLDHRVLASLVLIQYHSNSSSRIRDQDQVTKLRNSANLFLTLPDQSGICQFQV